jgi:hypothetical protein
MLDNIIRYVNKQYAVLDKEDEISQRCGTKLLHLLPLSVFKRTLIHLILYIVAKLPMISTDYECHMIDYE